MWSDTQQITELVPTKHKTAFEIETQQKRKMTEPQTKQGYQSCSNFRARLKMARVDIQEQALDGQKKPPEQEKGRTSWSRLGWSRRDVQAKKEDSSSRKSKKGNEKSEAKTMEKHKVKVFKYR